MMTTTSAAILCSKWALVLFGNPQAGLDFVNTLSSTYQRDSARITYAQPYTSVQYCFQFDQEGYVSLPVEPPAVKLVPGKGAPGGLE
jgi:hypothetical protein